MTLQPTESPGQGEKGKFLHLDLGEKQGVEEETVQTHVFQTGGQISTSRGAVYLGGGRGWW